MLLLFDVMVGKSAKSTRNTFMLSYKKTSYVYQSTCYRAHSPFSFCHYIIMFKVSTFIHSFILILSFSKAISFLHIGILFSIEGTILY